MPAHREATPRRPNHPPPPIAAPKSARRDSPRYMMSMQVLPEAFAVTGELGLTGASFAAWWAPEEEHVRLKVEFFGVKHELPAKVLKVEKGPRSMVVHLGFEALSEEAGLALARWVDHHGSWSAEKARETEARRR